MNTKRLEELIAKSKVSKQSICKQCGFTRPTLDNALSGGDIRISILKSLSDFFGVSVSYFFDEESGRENQHEFSITESQQRTIETLSKVIESLTVRQE
jgi:transcriptional regulator with XRE-family HTH domain